MAKTTGEGSGRHPFAGAKATASGSVRKQPDLFAEFTDWRNSGGIGPPMVETNRKTPKYGIPKGNLVQRKWPKR